MPSGDHCGLDPSSSCTTSPVYMSRSQVLLVGRPGRVLETTEYARSPPVGEAARPRPTGACRSPPAAGRSPPGREAQHRGRQGHGQARCSHPGSIATRRTPCFEPPVLLNPPCFEPSCLNPCVQCSIATEFLIVLALILANAVFAMSESPSWRRARCGCNSGPTMATNGRGPRWNWPIPAQFLSTVQVGITLVGVLAGAYGGATFAEPLAVRIATVLTGALRRRHRAWDGRRGISFLSLVLGELDRRTSRSPTPRPSRPGWRGR